LALPTLHALLYPEQRLRASESCKGPGLNLRANRLSTEDGRPRNRGAGPARAKLRGRAGGAGGFVTDKVVILVTAANQDESRKIARRLVEAELAACVNILPPIESVYRWQGQIAEEGECLLIIKSAKALFAEIETEILRLHSYQTPEIICLPIVEGSFKYLQWISESVKPLGAAETG
jgi:periplasmic divalent cation tolerance protein